MSVLGIGTTIATTTGFPQNNGPWPTNNNVRSAYYQNSVSGTLPDPAVYSGGVTRFSPLITARIA